VNTNHIEGVVEPGFEKLLQAFQNNFDKGKTSVPEFGAALAVYSDGDLVASLWGGYNNQALEAWQQNTAVCVFSCSKAVLSFCAHVLVAKGLLDYEKPVAYYWPEFAQAGKEQVTVRQVLNHQAGLPVIDRRFMPGEIFQWRKVIEALEEQPLSWEPGTAHGYHVLSFGHILGEVITRVSGVSLNHFVKEIFFSDHKEPGFSFGAGKHFTSLAEIQKPLAQSTMDGFIAKAESLGAESLANYNGPEVLTPPIVNSDLWKSALMPGANGFASAIGLAAIYRKLLDRRSSLLSPEHLLQVSAVESEGEDKTLKQNTVWGLGVQRSGGAVCFGSASGAGIHNFGHYGIYGSVGFADPERKIAVAYVKNQCGEPDDHSHAHNIIEALYQSV